MCPKFSGHDPRGRAAPAYRGASPIRAYAATGLFFPEFLPAERRQARCYSESYRAVLYLHLDDDLLALVEAREILTSLLLVLTLRTLTRLLSVGTVRIDRSR